MNKHCNCWCMDTYATVLQAFIRSTLDPIPQTIPLLTMIRVAEDIVAEIQKRHCPPAETYVFGLSLQMWPIFQKGMTEHIESVKKLAEGTSSGYFGRSSTTTTPMVENVRREKHFVSFQLLTDASRYADNMLFSSIHLFSSQTVRLTI